MADNDATNAIWQQPTTYDPMRHGPPYLPLMGKIAAVQDMVRVASDASYEELQTYLGQTGELGVLVSFMRSVSMIHQTHHWQTRGTSYYADHLLFERLYDESQDMIDSLAERAVGLNTFDIVDVRLQIENMSRIVDFLAQKDLRGAEGYVVTSLRSETLLLVLLKMAYQQLEGRGALSLGLDNLLQDIADKHESFVYLLKQRADRPIMASTRPKDPWKAWAR